MPSPKTARPAGHSQRRRQPPWRSLGRLRSLRWLRWLGRGVSLGRGLGELVYPGHCPLCGDRAGRGLCGACCERIGRGEGDHCERCGQAAGPFVEATVSGGGCWECRRRRWGFERVERLGLYEGALREACICGKGAGAEPLAAGLAEWFWECRGAALSGWEIDVVVPVPQHWSKRLLESHNQAETIAGVLARRLRAYSGRSILAKARRTPDQSSLPATRRRTNLQGAFRVRRRRRLRGAGVLLVDDILTTGTTADQAARALRRAGARRVDVAVLAVVPAATQRTG